MRSLEIVYTKKYRGAPLFNLNAVVYARWFDKRGFHRERMEDAVRVDVAIMPEGIPMAVVERYDPRRPEEFVGSLLERFEVFSITTIEAYEDPRWE